MIGVIMFTDVVFDGNGYINTEIVCAYLKYMNYTPAAWLHKACKYLKDKKLMLERHTKYLTTSSEVDEEARKQVYQIIFFGEIRKVDQHLQGRLVQSSIINEVGILRLCQAAKLFGHTADVAEKLLIYLGLNASVIFDEVNHLTPQIMRKAPTAKVTKVETIVVDTVVVDTVVGAVAVDDDASDDADSDAGNNALLQINNLDAVCEDSQFKDTLIWKKVDVILSSTFASFCEALTSQINRQIRRSAAKGDLVEGVDFIKLDVNKSSAFCEMNDVHLSPKEARNGLYLLTQVGVNNLSKYLKNEKAKIHSDVVSCSAAIIQDITRQGKSSTWLSDPQKLLNFLNKFTEHTDKLTAANSTLAATNSMLSDKITVLAEEYSDREESILAAYDKAAQTNKEILSRIQNMEAPSWSLGGGKKVLETMKAELGEIFVTKDSIFKASGMPSELISKEELRVKWFPGVNGGVSSGFLRGKGHLFKDWLLEKEGSLSIDNLLKIPSPVRVGIADRQIEFFQEATYVKTTDTYYKFVIDTDKGLTNFHVSKVKDDTELAAFMRLFCMYHPEYIFDLRTKELCLKSTTFG